MFQVLNSNIISVCFFAESIFPTDSNRDVLQFSGNVANELNKIDDEAKAMYAENVDNPYIPTKINKEYTL